jgi:hypothetical protein
MVLGHQLPQLPAIDRPHMRIAQALDRVGLAFEQHALDADQIAGQENHDDTCRRPSSIRRVRAIQPASSR